MFNSLKFNMLILVLVVSMVSLLLSSRWYSTEISPDTLQPGHS